MARENGSGKSSAPVARSLRTRFGARPRTFDMKITNGTQIPIEERTPDEVLGFRDIVTAPKGVNVYNPAFDVTGNRLIRAIITEAGIIRPPFKTNIKKAFSL